MALMMTSGRAMEPLLTHMTRHTRLIPRATLCLAGPSTRPAPVPLRPLRPFSTSSSRYDHAKDDEIRYREVHTVNQDGTLGELQSLWRLRQSVDPRTHSIVLVSEEPPIIRIFSKADLLSAERKREADAKAAKKLQVHEKEIQISWNTADGDLSTKLQHAKNHLEKGDKVMLVFAPRQGSKKKTLPDRMESIVGFFDKGLDEVASKSKDDEFKGRVVMSFWQPLSDVAKAVREKAVEFEGSRAREKDQKKEERRRMTREREDLAAKKREEDKLEGERLLAERQRELEAARQRDKEQLAAERERAEDRI